MDSQGSLRLERGPDDAVDLPAEADAGSEAASVAGAQAGFGPHAEARARSGAISAADTPPLRPFNVRRATQEDARAIAEVTVAGWRATYRHLLPAEYLDGLTPRNREAGWRSWLATDPDDRLPVWVAEVESEDGSAVAGHGVGGVAARRVVGPAAGHVVGGVAARQVVWPPTRRVVGLVSAGPPRDEDVAAPAAEVYAVYVHPDEQRHGIGRALLQTAVAHLRQHGATDLVLWVFERNPRARTFYEVMGWRPDGGRQALELAGASPVEIRYRLTAG